MHGWLVRIAMQVRGNPPRLQGKRTAKAGRKRPIDGPSIRTPVPIARRAVCAPKPLAPAGPKNRILVRKKKYLKKTWLPTTSTSMRDPPLLASPSPVEHPPQSGHLDMDEWSTSPFSPTADVHRRWDLCQARGWIGHGARPQNNEPHCPLD